MNVRKALILALVMLMIACCGGCGIIPGPGGLGNPLASERLRPIINHKGTLNFLVNHSQQTKITRTTTTYGDGHQTYSDSEYTYHHYVLHVKSSYPSINIEGIRLGNYEKVSSHYSLLDEAGLGSLDNGEFPVHLSRGGVFSYNLGGSMSYDRITIYTNVGDFVFNPQHVVREVPWSGR